MRPAVRLRAVGLRLLEAAFLPRVAVFLRVGLRADFRAIVFLPRLAFFLRFARFFAKLSPPFPDAGISGISMGRRTGL